MSDTTVTPAPLPDVIYCTVCCKDLPWTTFTDNARLRKYLKRRENGVNSPVCCDYCYTPQQRRRDIVADEKYAKKIALRADKRAAKAAKRPKKIKKSKSAAKIVRELIQNGKDLPFDMMDSPSPTPIQVRLVGSKALPFEERHAIYRRYLKSNTWLRVRIRIFKLRGYQCEKCGISEGVQLEVHHRSYERLGFELDSDLQILCRICHLSAHGRDIFGDRIQWK